MGNSASSSSKSAHDESVDYGFLTPQGVYSNPRDWNEAVVGRLIVERKLAPYYRPLVDYEDDWDDDRILAARKEPPTPTLDEAPPSSASTTATATASTASTPSITSRSDQSTIGSRHGHHHKRSGTTKDPAVNPEAAAYRGAVECPICFLYYPPNINVSRCCGQAICTECFVQIKRSEPTVTHLASDPACCPYCVQENFGVVYTPPPWRAGLGSEGSSLPPWPDAALQRTQSLPTPVGKQKRRKSFGPDDPDVVTIDRIRPDWEQKLQAVRAQAARRANRRIIMRQVGDRLIPVGITSGRVHALPAEGEDGNGGGGGGNGTGSGRRSRRRGQGQDIAGLLGGMAGPDLEELMVMEAMRLSLLEHEEQQRREREAQARNGNASGSADAESAPPPPPPSSSSPSAPPSAGAGTATFGSPASTGATTTPVRTPVVSTPPASAGWPRNAGAPHGPASGPATPTATRPELPSITTDTSALSLPPLERTNTIASAFTVDSVDSRADADGAGYGLLPSDSEESVVAREPLLRVDDPTSGGAGVSL